MMRAFFTILTLWALLLSPGLCLAGLLEHVCADSPEDKVTCGHEEICAEDPCLDALVRPDGEPDNSGTAQAATLERVADLTDVASAPGTLDPNLRPSYGKTLPFHKSDLPLLR